MNILEILILVIVVSTLNTVCFFIGAKVGQKVVMNEPIQAPNINPMEKIKESINKKEVQREQDRYETILQNIEKYDGTGLGQSDVPNI